MLIINRILYVVVGTILVVFGFLGIYGVFGVSGEYASQPFILLGQLVVPFALLIIGFYLLAQFYKKPDNKDKVKWFDNVKKRLEKERISKKVLLSNQTIKKED